LKKSGIKGKLKRKESLSKHTYLHVGGEARYFLYAFNIDEIRESIAFCEGEGMPYYIMGRGSNVLFSDKGFSGLVITTQRMDRISLEGEMIRAESGASLREIIIHAKDAGLTGLESLTGIPGTVGGGVIMNAGAYGCEIGDYVTSVYILKRDEVSQLKEFNFGYRDSSLKEEIVLEVILTLKEGNKREIENKIEEILKKRRSNLPEIQEGIGSCGSVFKNPEGLHAGMLIEKADLKGKRVGGAEIPMDHANYIFTYPSTKSHDVIELIRQVRDEVLKRYGVNLETEVIIVDEEKEIQI